MPIKVGLGQSTERDSFRATQDAVAQARINLHSEHVDLAIVFSSIEFAHSMVLKAIANFLGNIPLIGCSSLAIISNQGIFKHGLVIMLLSFSEDIYFTNASVKELGAKSLVNAGKELGEKLLYGFKDIRRDLSVVFCDGLISDSSSLIHGIQERLGMSFPLAGASASDRLTFKKTYLYSNQEVLSDAACGILMGGKLNFGLGTKHGWNPLGKPHTVTKAQGNIVYEIDGELAINFYKNYLAYDIARLKSELNHISVLYPIGIYLDAEKEFLLRNVISVGSDGSLAFKGDIPQGSSIRLMIGTKESCLAATRKAADEVKKNLAGKKINFVLIFDSVSRYILLGRQAAKELEIIKEALGDNIPIIGFYSYGEEAPLRAVDYLGKTYFHNQTITVLGIGG